jgi:uncharacterized protein (TIGR02271 family)
LRISRRVVEQSGSRFGRGKLFLRHLKNPDAANQRQLPGIPVPFSKTPRAGARPFIPPSVAANDPTEGELSNDHPAPGIEADGRIEGAENEALYTYYEGYLGGSAQNAGDAREDLSGRSDIQGRDTSGPTTDDAMTRSEERLHVGTEQAEVGRVRLRKHVVTENVTQTVPVSHEEVRLEREPITDANRGQATSGADISEEEHEVTLHAERPVTDKETVPVERVRLGKETVTEDHEVSETLRKEQIDDPDTDGTTR